MANVYQEILKLREEISQEKAAIRAKEATLSEREKKFKREAEEYGKKLDKEATAYERAVMNGRDTEKPELKDNLAKVVFKKPAVTRDGAMFYYVPAVPKIAKFLDSNIEKSTLFQYDPFFKAMEKVVVENRFMITIPEEGIEPYTKSFLPTIIHFVQFRNYSIDKALAATKEVLEGGTGFPIKEVNYYLYNDYLCGQEEEPKTDKDQPS